MAVPFLTIGLLLTVGAVASARDQDQKGVAASDTAMASKRPQRLSDIGGTQQMVRSADGTRLSVHEWGGRDRPTILLIHGGMQSYLSWQRQIMPLSREFHVVAFDARGHGASDKPMDAASYREFGRWSDDVDAVLRATGSDRATLVGWSMGGHIALDYIEKYGEDRVAGLILVDSGLVRGPGMASPLAMRLIGRLGATDLTGSIDASTAFLAACFHKQPSAAAFRTMLAYNMVVPPAIRPYLNGPPLDFDAVAKHISRPTLVIHGARDALITVAAAQRVTDGIMGAQLHVYPGVGHSPFYESAKRFNADVTDFVRTVSRPGRGER